MATTPNLHVSSTFADVRIDQVVADAAARLSNADDDAAIGAAVHALARRFGMTEVIIADVAKARDGVDDAIVFTTSDLPRLSFPRLLKHPIARRALAAKEAISLDEVLRSIGATSASLPRPLREHTALGVNVEVGDAPPISVVFAGKNAILTGLSRSVMSLIAHLAVERREHVKANPSLKVTLTDREAEAMRLLSRGLSDGEIADAMKIAPRTVRFHVANAKAKLGVATRAQAVVQTARTNGR